MSPMLWTVLQMVAQAEAPAPAVAAAASATRSIQVYWFLPPLVIAISLVYSASRHESWSRIGWQSLRLCGAILGILLATTLVLLLINTQV